MGNRLDKSGAYAVGWRPGNKEFGGRASKRHARAGVPTRSTRQAGSVSSEARSLDQIASTSTVSSPRAVHVARSGAEKGGSIVNAALGRNCDSAGA